MIKKAKQYVNTSGPLENFSHLICYEFRISWLKLIINYRNSQMREKERIKMIKKLITALLIITSLTIHVSYAKNITCTKVGEWGTDRYIDIATQGSYAFCAAEEAGLDIIDISNPANPKKIGNINTLFARKVWVNGNTKYAYLADTSDLKIIDISLPSTPKLIGTYDPNLLVQDMIVNGNYAFMIGSISSPDFFGAGEFHILDISNPANPTLIGKYKTDVLSSFYINNNYVYLTAYYYDEFEVMHSHLDIVNISNYMSPQKIGSVELDESDIRGIAMKSDYIYLGGNKLHIINVSNPYIPFQSNCIPITGSIVYDIYIDGDYAYAAIDDKGLDIFNITVPSAPMLVKNFQAPGDSHGVYIQGNYLYIADGNKGLHVINISTPTSPYTVGKSGGFISFKSINISGDYAYLGTSSHGLLIMNITDKTSPKRVGNYQLPYVNYYINAVQVKGNYAYILDGGYLGNRGFKILNIANPASPILVGSIDSFRAEHIFVNGNYAYTLGNMSGLTIIDVSEPTLPKVKGILISGEGVHGIFVANNYAYIAGEQHFTIINVFTPTAPFPSGSMNFNSYINSVFVRDNYAYAVSKEFYVLDVSQKNNPVLVGKCGDLGNRVTVNGNYAFIAASFLGLKAIDISVPTAPRLIGTFSTPGSAQYVDTDGNYVYVGDAGSGQFLIFKVSEAPSLPHLVLDKTDLNFASSATGFKTGVQKILIDNSGESDSNWQVSSNQAWLSCSPNTGKNAGVISVSVDATGFAPGIYNGTITVSDSNADNSPQTAAVTLKVYDTPSLSGPFGEFATPGAGSIVQNSIPITGWALDDIAIARVDIYREEGEALAYIGEAVFIEGARPDVETAYHDYPMNYKAGWGYMMLTNLLPGGGNGTLTLHAIATDIEGNQVTLGTKTIICANEHAAKPFGAIDTPTQGGTVTGNNFINWGWVLTAVPNMVPTDGSTIDVWVDGVNIGHPSYNIHRPDIASLFPNYANSEGAGGNFNLNTTPYKNGIHTIAWIAEDNAGNADGIGSRYFSIQKAGSDQNNKYNLARVAEICGIQCDAFDPVTIKQGFRKDGEVRNMIGDAKGFIRVELKELEPVEIRLSENEFIPEIKGFMVVGGQLRPLPIGSTLDLKKATFYWGPGLGFVGDYHLVFILKDQNGKLRKKNILIRIRDKGCREQQAAAPFFSPS